MVFQHSGVPQISPKSKRGAVSDWPRLDRVPRRGCGGSPGAGRRGFHQTGTLTDDYLWRLRFLQDLSGGLSGLTLNALTGRLNEVDKSIRYAANSGHVFRFSRTIWISASVSASVRRGRDLQSSLMVPW